MIKYPNNFRSSTNFSKVPDDQTDKAVNLALNTMKDKDESLHISFTGDTMILIMKMHEEDGGGYEIIVSNDYKQAYIDNEVFK